MNRILVIETSKYSGQLCNRLGLLAHFIAYCIEYQEQLLDFNFAHYAADFENLSGGLVTFFPPRRLSIPVNGITFRSSRWVSTFLKRSTYALVIEAELAPDQVLKEQYFNLDNGDFQQCISSWSMVFFKGWRFRCFDLVRKHGDAIRSFLAPKQIIEQKAKEFVSNIRTKKQTIVGVHIRLGDYKHHWGGRFYYTISQYQRLMIQVQLLLSTDKNVTFIIFSNEPQLPDLFPDLNVVLSNGSPIFDLSAMAQCDYLMGPPSSFSNWASFYGQVPLWHINGVEQQPTESSFQVYLPLEIVV